MGARFSDLGSVVLEVARRTGSETVDLSSGHARWEVYRRAMEAPAEWGPLLEIVGLEPDPSIAMSVVLQMLERVPEAERISWAERISMEDKRSLAVLRVRELRILDVLSGNVGAEYDPASDEISEWSDWLQRRASEESTSSRVLEQLSQLGRTRRVRHLSAERLRALRQC
ncbi:hypothetical protein [Streptomyces himalayensis]|uniref:Uncharacterized protein n=1 Tax=Streptomyces himalayensis subsp. himalayensis TaxID=2756131 RepID=A0A7W0DPP9_9ACTN|nr:hypothetical protein [Streptomyces himalayensis]MBA2948989.1 hypothetical protein [Streptomyces himalayensis subsp. himalayensis]